MTFRRIEFRDRRALKRIAIDFSDITMEMAMNHSIDTADRLTHVKIVAIALVVAIAVVWIGVAARATNSASNYPQSKANRLVVAPVKIMAVVSPATTVR